MAVDNQQTTCIEQEKLRSLPPLPATPALAHANSVLASARGRLSSEQQIELLLDPLQSQSLGVRSMALQVSSPLNVYGINAQDVRCLPVAHSNIILLVDRILLPGTSRSG